MFASSITRTRISFKRRGLFVARISGIMTRCTRSVCLASSGRPVEARRVCCGAGLRDEVSSAQLGNPTSNNIAILRRTLIAFPSSANATPLVNQLAVIPKKTFQFEPIPIEESPLNSDVIARLKRPKKIDIRSPSIVRERNQDPLSGLIAHFEGAALEVHLLHPPIDRLDPGSGSDSSASTLIPIPDAFLDADQIRIEVATRVLLQLHGHDVPRL